MAKQTRASRREYWQQVLQRQQASGLSIQHFCRREHLATATFFRVRYVNPIFRRWRRGL